MALRDHRRTPGRTRLWLLAGAALLALVVGVVRGLREPAPPAAERPAAREAAEAQPAPPAAEPQTPLAMPPGPAAGTAEPPAPVSPPSRREAVRALLEQDLAEHFPDRKLSSDELEAATDALMRLRAARLELRALPLTPENAERIRALKEEMGQAALDFEYVVDVDPITFTEKASGGFDEDEDEADEEEEDAR
jgi:hypothetical protein